MKHNLLSSIVFLVFASTGFAHNLKQNHEPSAKELSDLQSSPGYYNKRIYTEAAPDWSPIVDTTDFKYVLLSSETQGSESANLRYSIAQNLPEGVKLVLLVDASSLSQVKQTYSRYISLDRVIFAVDSNISNGFWARDAFPNPVVNSRGEVSLVSAKYYRNFKSGDAIAKALNLNMSKNNFTFVGGNLLADENGNCFSVDSYRRFTITPDDFVNAYGCKNFHSLQHYSGIGDVDEVVKPLGNGMIMTNTPEYAADFKSWGYNVIMLPDVPNSYRTYVNSLIVGKTVFMPTYGIAKDQEAKKVYEDLGYKVVGITSNSLSDDMHGSVHCQTMAYPQMPVEQLLSLLHLQQVN
jgi:hypothetical protein